MERALHRGSISTNCFDSLQVVSCIDFIQTAQQEKKNQMRLAALVCFEWLLLGLGGKKKKNNNKKTKTGAALCCRLHLS